MLSLWEHFLFKVIINKIKFIHKIMKIRVKLESSLSRKQRHQDTLKEMGARQISTEKNKRGDVFCYGTFKDNLSYNRFSTFAAEKSIKYEEV